MVFYSSELHVTLELSYACLIDVIALVSSVLVLNLESEEVLCVKITFLFSNVVPNDNYIFYSSIMFSHRNHH